MGFKNTLGVPRLGIPHLSLTDAGLGVASQAGADVRAGTALPSGLATAASWDLDGAYAGGAMIGAKARARGFNVMLAGGVNLLREPRNGRNLEYAGEDPLLAGQIVGAHIRAIQSNHVVSTLKHFALSDQESGRTTLNVRIDEAASRMSSLGDAQDGMVLLKNNGAVLPLSRKLKRVAVVGGHAERGVLAGGGAMACPTPVSTCPPCAPASATAC
jgi:beta-glucosidase-like glycosyl hydrolase